MQGIVLVALVGFLFGSAVFACPNTESQAVEDRMLRREGERLLDPRRVEKAWGVAVTRHPEVAGVALASTRFSDWRMHYDGRQFRLVFVYDETSHLPEIEGNSMITLRFEIETEYVPVVVRRGSKEETVKREVVSSVVLAEVQAYSGISWLE